MGLDGRRAWQKEGVSPLPKGRKTSGGKKTGKTENQKITVGVVLGEGVIM